MTVIGRCVDDTLFLSDILLAFMYVMIVLIPDHAQKVTPVGKGVMGVMITNINCSCENYNDLIHFITHCYLLLACFLVGIM